MEIENNARPVRVGAGATNARGEPLKQERAERTRASVLEAAAESFAAKGYPAVTILDVAKLAGLTKGAVYFHFTNKEALALAVAEEFYSRVGRVAETLRGEDCSPLDRAMGFVRRSALLFRDDRVVQAGARLQIERPFIESSLPMPYVDAQAALTEFLADAQRAGQLKPSSDPEALARVLLSAFFGAQHMSWVFNDRQDLVERVEEIVRGLFSEHGF
ncbi:ScbR family autoregulator-binding transcription factor [Streptomyces chiangmaiensis]